MAPKCLQDPKFVTFMKWFVPICTMLFILSFVLTCALENITLDHQQALQDTVDETTQNVIDRKAELVHTLNLPGADPNSQFYADMTLELAGNYKEVSPTYSTTLDELEDAKKAAEEAMDVFKTEKTALTSTLLMAGGTTTTFLAGLQGYCKKSKKTMWVFIILCLVVCLMGGLGFGGVYNKDFILPTAITVGVVGMFLLISSVAIPAQESYVRFQQKQKERSDEAKTIKAQKMKEAAQKTKEILNDRYFLIDIDRSTLENEFKRKNKKLGELVNETVAKAKKLSKKLTKCEKNLKNHKNKFEERKYKAEKAAIIAEQQDNRYKGYHAKTKMYNYVLSRLETIRGELMKKDIPDDCSAHTKHTSKIAEVDRRIKKLKTKIGRRSPPTLYLE